MDSNICIAWIYNHTSIIAIYEQKKVVGSGLGLGVLGRSFSEIIVIEKILRRLVFFYESDWKVIDLVA